MFEHVVHGNGRFYRLTACTVMPDHVHIMLTPNMGYTLARIMRGIKGVSAHKVNNLRGKSGVSVWQQESFDRIIRSESDLLEKLNYMLQNPVKRGLADDPWKYPFWYLDSDSRTIDR